MQRRSTLVALGSLAFGATPLARAQAATAANDIVIGQSAVISGPLGGPIKAMISGAQLAFDAVNAQGGVQGRKIRLVTLDDELAPPKAVANYKKLLDENGVVAASARAPPPRPASCWPSTAARRSAATRSRTPRARRPQATASSSAPAWAARPRCWCSS